MSAFPKLLINRDPKHIIILKEAKQIIQMHFYEVVAFFYFFIF